MKIFQTLLRNEQWSTPLPVESQAQWVLVFGNRSLMRDAAFRKNLLSTFPKAQMIGCTTSGEIIDTEIHDDSIALTAIHFEQSSTQTFSINATDFASSYAAGIHLAQQLPKEGLRHVFIISNGQLVNGTELVKGVSENLGNNIMLTGGFAGDAERFEETVVWHNDQVEPGLIVLTGFYGASLQIGHGSLAGWDAFGPDRLITRAEGNILYELDHKSALALYKKYLGEFASELPASALRFPLSIRSADHSANVVRTILNINETQQSMTFAGDMPEGAYAKLMRSSFSGLIDGAIDAAVNAAAYIKLGQPELAILISCVGRRLVLQQETEEELECIQEVLSPDCILCGFYSYGEISPIKNTQTCAVHNQTMTITTFSESTDA